MIDELKISVIYITVHISISHNICRDTIYCVPTEIYFNNNIFFVSTKPCPEPVEGSTALSL